MAKVVIAENLKDEILKKFKEESKKIFRLMYSFGENPHKGKELGNAGGIVIKESRYKGFRFYFITDGYKLKVMSESDADECMEMIKSRNQTSHIYHEEIAEDIANKVPEYYALMESIIGVVQKKMTTLNAEH